MLSIKELFDLDKPATYLFNLFSFSLNFNNFFCSLASSLACFFKSLSSLVPNILSFKFDQKPIIAP
ncbi:Uncharacterised protein [Chlamydia abortus]|nr:Uncharacterised protein [Chlamydia abortus]SGA31325.1 Uncharacterised protein [Chlamydia abortus]